MNYTIVRIGIVIILLYMVGFIFFSFTLVGMKKHILDINSTHTTINITMPEYGDHIEIRLEVDKDSILKGNVTIKENNTTIYHSILDKKYTVIQKSYAFYSVPNDMNDNTLLKEKKNYTFEIELEKIKSPISLKLSWLEGGFYTLFSDGISWNLQKEEI